MRPWLKLLNRTRLVAFERQTRIGRKYGRPINADGDPFVSLILVEVIEEMD